MNRIIKIKGQEYEINFTLESLKYLEAQGLDINNLNEKSVKELTLVILLIESGLIEYKLKNLKFKDIKDELGKVDILSIFYDDMGIDMKEALNKVEDSSPNDPTVV